MPKRVAKVDQLYYCRPVKAGDAFDVDAGDVEVMLLLGRIEEERPAESPPEIRPGTYATRDMVARRAQKATHR